MAETSFCIHDNELLICDLGFLTISKFTRVNFNHSRHFTLYCTAPEVFHTRKFTKKSDVYSFGIIMHLMATGEPPFRDRQFDTSLIREIMDGLRPPMPDSAPEEYKKLAERCCNADPDKRPYADTLFNDILDLIGEVNRGNSDDNTWNTIYRSDVKPLSCFEKESKYSSTLLPTGDLPKPRNS